MHSPNWDSYRHILAIARSGTLSGAARRLGIDQTTVSRRLAATEVVLGAKLFDRIGGQMKPTDAGTVAIARIARMEEAADDLKRCISAAGSQPSGVIRLTAVPFLINQIIVPALPEFCAAFPGITLDLIPDARNLSLTRREADIALRLSRPNQDAGALIRQIGDLAFTGYSAHEAASTAWIGYTDGLRHLPQAARIQEELDSGTPAAPLTVEDVETAREAVAAGFGVSLLPCCVGDRDPRLRRVSGSPSLTRPLWLMVYEDIRRAERVSVFIDWLLTHLPDPKGRLDPKPATPQKIRNSDAKV